MFVPAIHKPSNILILTFIVGIKHESNKRHCYSIVFELVNELIAD